MQQINIPTEEEIDYELAIIREEIKRQMKKRGISIRKLSLISDVSFCAVQRFLNGDGTPTLYTFVKLCKSLELEIL